MLHNIPRSSVAGSRPGAIEELGLDQARVGSMADEGGSAGATMDAYEQCTPAGLVARPRRSWPRWIALGAVVFGVAVVTSAWLSRLRRTR